MIVACLGIAVKENWHYVPELIVDNWQKATHIVWGRNKMHPGGFKI
jgi:flavin-dependent dehydrogenase